MKTPTDFITAGELAELLGVGASAVSNALRAGRIQYADKAKKLFSGPQAIAAWYAHAQRIRTPLEAADALLEARAKREAAAAAMAELRLRQATGELVQADVVHEAAFRWARNARDAFMSLPDRIAAEVAAETDITKVHARIAAEVRRICEDLAANRPTFGNTLTTTPTTEGNHRHG